MTDQEEKLLYALALMVRQYLPQYPTAREVKSDAERVIDSMAMGAGESAILMLVEYGMMEDATQGRIMGRWTEAGKKLLESSN